jgi:uncharacterized protein (TIGR03435 family)
MPRHSLVAAAFLLSAAPVFAQSHPQFDVASVKPSAEQAAGTAGAAVRITGRQLRFAGLALKDYVGMAYGLRPMQVNGPDWLATAKFDITVTTPEGSPQDQFPDMMRDLLESRFQLKAHREQREFPVYLLKTGKNGVKMTRVADAPPTAPSKAPIEIGGGGSAAGVNISLGDGTTFSLANNKIEVTQMTMEQLADVLTRFSDRTVRDATGLDGRYNASIDLSPEEYQATLIRSAVNAGVVLPPQALRLLDNGPTNPLGGAFERAGLALESGKAPLDIVVVDSASKTPAEN